MALFLLRYAEMGLKSEKVRRRFQQSLIENIEEKFVRIGGQCIVSWDRGRLYVMADEAEKGRRVLSHTFGIVSFSEAVETGADKASIMEGVISYAAPLLGKGRSFAIRARRTGQQHFTSIELARDAGEAILERFHDLSLRVDLESPDVPIHIDAREKGAYIYSEVEEGPGGLPLGTQGTVLCPLATEEDMLAAWMMMRRGCRVVVATDNPGLAGKLEEWDPGLTAIPPVANAEVAATALKHGCKGIALSSGLREIKASGLDKEGLAVLYPLVGLTPGERAGLLDRIA